MTAITKQKEDKIAEKQSIESELDIMQRLRRFQCPLAQYDEEFQREIAVVSDEVQRLQIQPNTLAPQNSNN